MSRLVFSLFASLVTLIVNINFINTKNAIPLCNTVHQNRVTGTNLKLQENLNMSTYNFYF